MSTYKAVCKSIMAVLARRISEIHRINVMQHSDIETYLEDSLIRHYTPILARVEHMLRKQLSMTSIVGHLERVKRNSNAKIAILLHNIVTKVYIIQESQKKEGCQNVECEYFVNR